MSKPGAHEHLAEHGWPQPDVIVGMTRLRSGNCGLEPCFESMAGTDAPGTQATMQMLSPTVASWTVLQQTADRQS